MPAVPEEQSSIPASKENKDADGEEKEDNDWDNDMEARKDSSLY